MSGLDSLKLFVHQRLTAAAQEILGHVERTISEYEEKLLQLHSADVPQLPLVESKEETPLPGVEQEEPPDIKEEPEELWSPLEGEQLQDITNFPFTPDPHLQSETDNSDDYDWTDHGNLPSCQLDNSPAGSSSAGPPTHVHVIASDWVSSYEVPWEIMPASLLQSVAQGQKPRKHERLAMVRVIVDSIRNQCLNPTRNQCSEIVRSIVRKYPMSFADVTIEGEPIGCGYSSLLNQIKSRVENCNRANPLVRIRRPKRNVEHSPSTARSETTPSKCSKTDSYGCIRWNPLHLPENQTPESMEEKRMDMVRLFSTEGLQAADRGQVAEYMDISYASQRYSINANPPPSVDELKERWPFLFVKRFLCAHFNTLTGIDINTRLTESLSRKGKRVLHFFESQLSRWKEEVRGVLTDIHSAGDVDYGVASMLTIMAHFREREDSLFLLLGDNATAEDVRGSLSVPSSPRLIAFGDSVLCAKKWMLAIEGTVIIQSQELTDFQSALAVLMGSYYVFNVQYQEEAASTLEFIQRFILRINPDGSKCQSKSRVSRTSGKNVQRKSTYLNPLVASLIRELVDFVWQRE